MKHIFTGLCILAVAWLHGGCARSNVFSEPPGYPVVDSLAPASGRIGTQVRLYGSGFSTTLAHDTVNINGVRVRVDASTSTVLLVTLIDSTGTGHVNVKVKGQSAQGPIFTYLGGAPPGNAPVITGGGFGWQDESGYWVNVKTLPPADSDIRLFIGGVEVPIAIVTRDGSPYYDPVQGYRLMVYNEAVLTNTVDIYANFQVTYSGVPSNVYPYQLKPIVTNIESKRGDYVFAVGDTVTITGEYFGAPSLPSFVSLRWNGQQLPNPAILSWTNTKIRAVMPAYPEVLIDAAIPVSIQVGQIESRALGCRYLGIISGTVYLIAGSNDGTSDGHGSSAQFSFPEKIALNAAGDLYVADHGNNRIRKITNITPSGGDVTTLSGTVAGFLDGAVGKALFNQPYGVAVDETGAVYVADGTNNRVRIISGDSVATFAGDGNPLTFSYPTGIAMNNHNLAYVADLANHRIQVIINHNIGTLAGSTTAGFQDGTGAAAKFNQPAGVALGLDGTVYVADQLNNAIRKITPGGIVTTLAGGTLGITDGIGAAAKFTYPWDLAVDAQGNVYVTDIHHIRKITPQGVVSTLAHEFSAPRGIAVDGQGALYICDYGVHRIYKMIP